MKYPYPIRLRGPWELEPLVRSVPQADGTMAEETHDLPPAIHARLPADWSEALGADFRGLVRYRRRFNRPTGLEPHERVWLCCDGADAVAEVTLNGHHLGRINGPALPAEFDVTAQLEPHNELAINVACPALPDPDYPRPGREALPGGLIGEVRLEVRTTES